MNRRRTQTGQAIIYLALVVPTVLGLIGISVDVGYLEYLKRTAQAAADAAAIAGAQEVPYKAISNDITAAARAASASNHFTHGSGGATVTVNSPPLLGLHTGNANYVEVIISQSQSTFFLNMVGLSTATVASRAVAVSTGSGTPGPSCLYLLGTSGIDLDVTGSESVTGTSCGISVDSSSSNAIKLTGSATISAASIGVAGGTSVTGSGSISPTPVTGIVPASDPLSYLPVPTVASCSNTSMRITGSGTSTVTPGTNCYDVSVTGSSTVTFNPGEYSAISLTGSPTITFNPGLYTIANGDLSLTGSGSISGSGVSFYLGPNAGSVSYTGSGGGTLSAPTTGTYAGILFYQSPSDTNDATFTGSSSSVFDGVLYFPDASITWTGSQSTLAEMTVVAQSVNLTGSASLTLSADFAGFGGSAPIKHAVLVE